MSAVAPSGARHPGPIPACAGIGLRAPHYRELLADRPPLGWLEVHSENYFGDGPPLDYLEQLRAHYPVSLHGVGLSLGSTDPLDRRHLRNLKALIARVAPGLVSEHLSWSSVGGTYLNDLLPLPYTEEALALFIARVGEAQDFLGRELLIENPSSYLQYRHSTIPEAEFLAEIARASGCGLLLDVNNVYVSAANHGFDALRYLRTVPAAAVKEIHLAGFSVNRYADGEVLIDTHSTRVAPPVWALYRAAVQRLGRLPTLIEWDTDIPALAVLLDEMRQADAVLNEPCHADVA
ncbi:MAG: DUF692 domain-containing protein [Gammaproteobacteria bacterium]|nr:DUF692 domain-containing protein [Gammaproteobacteria bacterium]